MMKFVDTGRSMSFSFAHVAPDNSYSVTEKLMPALTLKPQPCGCLVAGSTSHVCPAHPQLALAFARGGDAE